MLTEEEIYNSKNLIQNAIVARDKCKEGSWGWLYWENVRGELLRKLKRSINKQLNTAVDNLTE